MTGPLILLSNTAAAIVRFFVYLLLISRLLPAQKSPDKKNAGRTGRMMLSGIAGTAAMSAVLYITEAPDLYQMILETVWITFCGVRFQRTDMRMNLFVGIFYEIAVSFWQFLITAWTGVFFHTPAVPDPASFHGQLAVWLFHALLAVLGARLWKHRNAAGDTSGEKAFRSASGIIVAGFIAVVTLSQQTILPIADDTLDMWTILAVVLMMSVLVFNMKRQYEVEKELARLRSEQAELLERDYTALNEAYAVNARLFHDFHNHIGALRQLLSHRKLEEAVQYLDELQAPAQEMADTIWTGDETVDYLINSKIRNAAENGIQYQVQVEFPRRTNLQSADLCAIVGNLLDNAFEAAQQIPEREKRFVRLTIRRINQMLIIKVENSFITPPAVTDGVLLTIKEQNGLHGWGLKSARTAAGKYDGTVQTAYTDNLFRAVATLSYQGITNMI